MKITIMSQTEYCRLLQWLTERSGPIIRYLIAHDLYDEGDTAHRQTLLQEVVTTDVVRRWLSLLGTGDIHGARDACAENCLAKLCEFGLRAGTPELDAKVLFLLDRFAKDQYFSLILPFLCWAGYGGEAPLHAKAQERLVAIAQTASLPTFSPFLDSDELQKVPRVWHSKPIFRRELDPFGGTLPLPWCYDLHLLAHFPLEDAETGVHIDAVVELLLRPEYQAAGVPAYIWTPEEHICHTCATFQLPGYRGFTDADGFNPRHLIFTLEALARFPQVQRSEWFHSCIHHLEQFRTTSGTYLFPRTYLEEREGYYLYNGMHMGLGENRRQKQALAIESTFRMLRIYRLAAMVVD